MEKADGRDEATRQRIRRAGRDLFLRRGFEATTTDAIAAAARMSKQTVYRFYRSKEALFTDVIREATIGTPWPRGPLSPNQVRVADAAALEAVLLDLAAHIVETMLDPEFVALVRTVIAEAPRFPALADGFRATLADRGSANVAALLDRSRDAGVVVAPDSRAAARLFLGGPLFAMVVDGLLAGSQEPRAPTRQEVAAHVRLVVAAVTAPLGPAGSSTGASEPAHQE